jgi:hypothetical protein
MGFPGHDNIAALAIHVAQLDDVFMRDTTKAEHPLAADADDAKVESLVR